MCWRRTGNPYLLKQRTCCNHNEPLCVVFFFLNLWLCVCFLKVFCAACCSLKCKLVYMDRKEARVCVTCHSALTTGEHHRSNKLCQLCLRCCWEEVRNLIDPILCSSLSSVMGSCSNLFISNNSAVMVFPVLVSSHMGDAGHCK